MNWAAAAIVLGMTTSAGLADEAKVLSDRELDSVTAAGVFVDVNSLAAASGDRTRTFTDADTFTIAGKSFDLGVGFTLGKALACCGEEAAVEVDSAVLGVGDIVQGAKQAVKNDNGHLALGVSAGFVVAVSYDDPVKMLRELRRAWPHLGSEPPASAAE